ncbi:MAG: Holliday junction branch migration protein RuvA [Clostridia bacterium]|nr:Holliday junction branch migration protein RuvA [Clostridia bacterium]
MYAYMIGKITDRFEQGIVLEVSNIGYNIFMSENEINRLDDKEEVKIFTYFDHKEEYMRLFGFENKKRLEFFKKLISVNGVGAKMGMAIMNALEVESLATAIATDDVNVIKSAPGVGPKLAAKIIIELKDKIENDEMIVKKNKIVKNKNLDEAIVALKVLGYTDKDINSCIDEIEVESKTTQDIIKAFLKYLGTNK